MTVVGTRWRAFVRLVLTVCAVFVSSLASRGGYCADFAVPMNPEIERPGAATGPTRVSVGIWVADVTRIDSASQTFDANLFIVLRWRDPRLAHGQTRSKRYERGNVWMPEWLIANAAGPLVKSFPEVVEVAGDGMVTYRQRFIGSFEQPLDLRTFPFDDANFHIHFIMVGHGQADFEFVPIAPMVAAGMPHGAGIAQNLTVKDWHVTGCTAYDSPYQVAPGLAVAGYAFEFHAQRLTRHYVMKVIMPLFLIVMMSWTVFWIDPSLGSSQVSVAITSMLTLITYRFSVGNEVPKLPYLTHLDSFILLCTMLVFLALVEVIVTTSLAYNNRPHHATMIDRYSRVVFPLAFAAIAVMTLIH